MSPKGMPGGREMKGEAKELKKQMKNVDSKDIQAFVNSLEDVDPEYRPMVLGSVLEVICTSVGLKKWEVAGVLETVKHKVQH